VNRVVLDVAQLNAEVAEQITPWLQRVGRWADGIATGRAAGEVVQKRSGQYQRGIESSVETTGFGVGVMCVLRGTAEHSAVIEDGSKPHVIKARADNPTGRLRFQVALGVGANGQISGIWRSPQQVNHPGTKPTRLLQEALYDALEANGCVVTRRQNIERK
jgi:hypothetical protein